VIKNVKGAEDLENRDLKVGLLAGIDSPSKIQNK
jgi:hypothetical protein